MGSLQQAKLKYAIKRQRKRKMLRIGTILGCIVVFATAFALMIPAITMTRTELTCGLQEHTHTDACYGRVLTCDKASEEGHIHSDECYAQELVCGMEEHQHDDGCYTVVDLSEESATTAGQGNEEGTPNASGTDASATSVSVGSIIDGSANDKMPAQNFKGELVTDNGKKLIVQVEAPKGALPLGTTMKIESVENASVEEVVGDAVATRTADKVVDMQAVDITFIDSAGNEIEPAKKITVKFASELISKDDAPMIVHVDDYGKADVVDKLSDKELERRDKEVKDNELLIDSDKFSVYVLAYTVEISADVLSVDGQTYTITVSYDESAGIPVGAELVVEELLPETPEYQEYLADSADTLGIEAASIPYARFFDINIVANGRELQPAASVSVQIAVADASQDPVSVIHFAEGGPTVLAAEQSEAEGGGIELSFATDGFSTYGVITGPGPSGVTDLAGYSATISINGRYVLSSVNTDDNPARLEKGSELLAAEWTFEPAETEGQYNIFTMVGGQKQYINFGPPNPENELQAAVTLSDQPQGLTVSTSDNGTYQISWIGPERTYYLNEYNGQGGTGFAGWYNQNDENARLTFTFDQQPISSGEDQYMLLAKVGDTYYIILNNGELEETEYPVNGDANMVAADTPMLWTYNGSDHLYHPSEAAAYTDQQIACAYRYCYIDPEEDDGLYLESQDEITLSGNHPPHNTRDVTARSKWDDMAITYNEANHTIVSASDPTKVLKVTQKGKKLVLAGGNADGEVAEIYFARVVDPQLKLGPEYHTVNHIDISVEASATVNVPLAWGTYYYVEDGEVKSLVVNRENQMTLSLSKNDVPIGVDDIKTGEVVAYKKNEDGSQTVLQDAFIINEYSRNQENGQSTDQVRLGGVFKVADLPPVENGNGNGDATWRARRLDPENRVYYSVSTTKDVEFNMQYNGHQLYGSETDARASMEEGYDVTTDENALMVNSKVTLAASFDYWDSRNECPGIHLLGHTTDWRNGDIFADSNNYAGNPANTGMDFALGTHATGSTDTVAIEITKYLVDTGGNRITPNQELTQSFNIYRKAIDKDADPNPIDEVKGLDVGAYDENQTQPDYNPDYYKFVHSKTVRVGDGGVGIVYDYDVSPGMIYVEEDTSSLQNTVTDIKGKRWEYTKTYLETEYVWRNDGIENRRHVSKEFTSEAEAYRSIPDVLGAYKDVEGFDQFNGFLEFYVYNVYESQPTDISVKKIWKHENGTEAEAPEGARLTATLGRFKLAEDENNPITGSLKINQTIVDATEDGLPETSTFQATYTVKRDGITIRTGSYSQAQSGDLIAGLPAGTYTVTISSYVEGYSVTNDPTTQIVTLTQQDIANRTPVQVPFTSTVQDKEAVKTVKVRVTNSIDGSPNYQDGTYTFPGGSTIGVSFSRPGPGHNNSFTVRVYRDGQEITYTPPQSSGDNAYAGVSQILTFELPDEGEVQIGIWHNWEEDSLHINSVTQVASSSASSTNSASGTSGTSNVLSAPINALRAPALRVEAATIEQDDVIDASRGQEAPSVPQSPIEGMIYVEDTDWSTEEQPVTIVLSGATWEKSLSNLPAVDDHGNAYLYFIKSVHEEGVPEGTSMRIDLTGDNVIKTSTGDDVLTVTNTMPNKPPNIKIKKVDENGMPMTGVKFTISKDGGTPEEFEITSGDGVYTLANLEAGSYVINETAWPEGYGQMSGSITFDVAGEDGDYVISNVVTPYGVEYADQTLTFTVENTPKQPSENLVVRKQWLDCFGNLLFDNIPESLNLTLVQWAPGNPEQHTVRVYFRCTGNGHGGVDFPGQIVSITDRTGTGAGDMVITWDWNQWTLEQPFIVDGLEGSTYTSTWSQGGAQSQGDGRGGRQTVTIHNITKDLIIYITIRNNNYDGTNDSLIYSLNFTGENPVIPLVPTGGTKIVTLGTTDWSQSFKVEGDGNLSDAIGDTIPATYNGEDCYYTISEDSVPEGYTLRQISTEPVQTGVLSAYNKKTTTELTVVKSDIEDPSKRLEGATFEFHKLAWSLANPCYYADEGVTKTTESDGVVTFDNLELGSYYEIKEANAPVGYTLPSDSTFYIAVTDSGIVRLKKIEGEPPTQWPTVGSDTLVEVVGNTATVFDEPGKPLPSTGGMGTGLFTVLGAALMAAGVAVLIIRRKRQVALVNKCVHPRGRKGGSMR